MAILHICYDVKTASSVLEPFFLNKYSVINNTDILFKFRLCIVSTIGKTAVALICFFPRVCTKFVNELLGQPSYLLCISLCNLILVESKLLSYIL